MPEAPNGRRPNRGGAKTNYTAVADRLADPLCASVDGSDRRQVLHTFVLPTFVTQTCCGKMCSVRGRARRAARSYRNKPQRYAVRSTRRSRDHLSTGPLVSHSSMAPSVIERRRQGCASPSDAADAAACSLLPKAIVSEDPKREKTPSASIMLMTACALAAANGAYSSEQCGKYGCWGGAPSCRRKAACITSLSAISVAFCSNSMRTHCGGGHDGKEEAVSGPATQHSIVAQQPAQPPSGAPERKRRASPHR